MPFSNGRNYYVAATQGVFYVANWIGTVNCEVSWFDQKGNLKSKTKTFTNGTPGHNLTAGWSNPRNLWRSWGNRVLGWSKQIPTTNESNTSQKITKRLRVRLPNPVVNEIKFRIYSDLADTSFDLVAFSIEKVNVGAIGDII